MSEKKKAEFKHRLAGVSRPYLKEIVLVTGSGDHVASASIPYFNQPPDSLLWGERVFNFDRNGSCDPGVWMFRECFGYVLPNECVHENHS